MSALTSGQINRNTYGYAHRNVGAAPTTCGLNKSGAEPTMTPTRGCKGAAVVSPRPSQSHHRQRLNKVIDAAPDAVDLFLARDVVVHHLEMEPKPIEDGDR